MLIRSPILKRIKSGEVTLAFRRWRRPTVKAGGTLKTAIGVLDIRKVEEISLNKISAADARRAGFASKNELISELGDNERQLFRITLAYAGVDPRIALRENDDLSEQALRDLLKRLQRMDSRSQTGPWVLSVMSAISAHPKVRAADLAAAAGFEKVSLKANVRKLKNLGLTISHEQGYTLSPRGVTVIESLKRL